MARHRSFPSGEVVTVEDVTYAFEADVVCAIGLGGTRALDQGVTVGSPNSDVVRALGTPSTAAPVPPR